MSRIILICGKICSGKSTYTKRLISENHAVWLSVDEILLSLFGQHLGERHDEISARTREYLMKKSLEISQEGIPVILDFGFWRKADRDNANEFYGRYGIRPEWHYVDVSDEVWRRNIEKRNRDVEKGEKLDYFIDRALAEKFESMFEMPSKEEMDVWYTNEW